MNKVKQKKQENTGVNNINRQQAEEMIKSLVSTEDLEQVKILWIKEVQKELQSCNDAFVGEDDYYIPLLYTQNGRYKKG